MVNKKGKKVKIIIIAIVLILLVFLLFPRKYQLLDGGSTGYRGFMYIYSIEDRCSFVSLNGDYYYEKGTVITILGIEIYNGTEVDELLESFYESQRFAQ